MRSVPPRVSVGKCDCSGEPMCAPRADPHGSAATFVLLAGTAKVIVQPDDVVFAQIFAALHLDEDERFIARVFDAMRGADSNLDRLAGVHNYFFVVERDFRNARDFEPVLRALSMFLITQSLARQPLDALDLKAVRLIKHRVVSPRPRVELRGTISNFFSHPCSPQRS